MNPSNPPKKASRTVVALEVRVVELVEVVAGPRPLEAVVAEPGPDRAVDDTGEEDRRVAAERHADERGGVVPGGLDWMHVGAGERGGVVRLVMQRVHVLVQEPTDVREPPLRALFKPGVHAAVDGPELQTRQTANEWTWVVAPATSVVRKHADRFRQPPFSGNSASHRVSQRLGQWAGQRSVQCWGRVAVAGASRVEPYMGDAPVGDGDGPDEV